MAVNCWLAPTMTLGLAGVTAIEERVTAATVTARLAVPVMPLKAAEMVKLPNTPRMDLRQKYKPNSLYLVLPLEAVQPTWDAGIMMLDELPTEDISDDFETEV